MEQQLVEEVWPADSHASATSRSAHGGLQRHDVHGGASERDLDARLRVEVGSPPQPAKMSANKLATNDILRGLRPPISGP
jgi:hypothetical protein